MSNPDPYAHSEFRGRPLDNATIAALKLAEQKLGYELTINQGIGGAAASAGSHTLGRAVDLASWDYKKKLRVLKDIGFAAWIRPYRPGVWNAHIHAILIFENRRNSRGLDGVGFRQIASYDASRDGLVSNALDRSYRPAKKAVFTVKDYEKSFAAPAPKGNRVTQARDALTQALHAAGEAQALLDDVDPSRVVARSQMEQIQAVAEQLEAVLKALPKK
jgi:hypothetical protein